MAPCALEGKRKSGWGGLAAGTSIRVLTNPSTWRALSSALLVVFAVSFLVAGFEVPRWGWIALLLSGVAFAIEMLLIAARIAAWHPVTRRAGPA